MQQRIYVQVMLGIRLLILYKIMDFRIMQKKEKINTMKIG